jgi:hypothetical protein
MNKKSYAVSVCAFNKFLDQLERLRQNVWFNEILIEPLQSTVLKPCIGKLEDSVFLTKYLNDLYNFGHLYRSIALFFNKNILLVIN